MLTLDSLKNFGANVEGGMARCINNEDFYMRMVRMAIADANFDKLLEAAEAGDTKTGFEAAHALHEKMGCICFENPSMGIYFIQDPDGYWLEVIPTR